MCKELFACASLVPIGTFGELCYARMKEYLPCLLTKSSEVHPQSKCAQDIEYSLNE
jgi:hypothetical protein